MSKLKEMLTGRSRDHVLQFENTHIIIHRDVETPLNALQKKARSSGFDLAVASGFRDYNSQLPIGKMKATGKRAVLDSSGMPLDISKLTSEELVYAILRWSSLPGTSRHH